MIMVIYSQHCPKMKGHKYESGTITWIEYKIIYQSFIIFLIHCFEHFPPPFKMHHFQNICLLDIYFFSKVNKR